MRMTKEQVKLVEDNIRIVNIVIKANIILNNSNPDFTYEEIYQIGCMALCDAAMKYRSDKGAEFFTFAYGVVERRIIDHCRKAVCRHKHAGGSFDDVSDSLEVQMRTGSMEEQRYLKKLIAITKYAKSRYTGVILKGVEAIEFKALGYSGREIADLYGVKTNNVSSWVAKARRKLRSDPEVMRYFDDEE